MGNLQIHNPIIIDQDKLMTSLQMAEAFGQLHKDVLRRLKTLIDDDGLFELGVHYTPSSYLGKDGSMTPQLEINFDIAFLFASSSRKKNSRQLIKSMFETKIEQLKFDIEAHMRKELDAKSEAIQVLQNESRKTIANPRAASTMAKHELYQLWDSRDWISTEIKYVKDYKYKITEIGKEFLKKLKSGAIELV